MLDRLVELVSHRYTSSIIPQSISTVKVAGSVDIPTQPSIRSHTIVAINARSSALQCVHRISLRPYIDAIGCYSERLEG